MQCMHEGANGPCEREAKGVEFFCARHGKKTAKPKPAKTPAAQSPVTSAVTS